MKTKNKAFTSVEIAIVLCSVFLVALPTIAAASEIYEPGPLDVFGNANEDDTIDMRDTTYIKLVIFGKKPKTDLADANNDGKISMLDVGQAKLIILGKEKKLTYIDIFGEAETVNKPIKRLANFGNIGIQVTRALGAMDIMLPVVSGDKSGQPIFYPEFSKWPFLGWKAAGWDYEYILGLRPDAVQTNFEMKRFVIEGPKVAGKRLIEEKLPGMPLISLNMREADILPRSLGTYGYILDREDEAEEFINWFVGYHNKFNGLTEGLSEDEKPRVYYASSSNFYKMAPPGNRIDQVLVLAGGKNIGDEIIGPDDPMYGFSSVDVDPEWVVEQNPDFIFSWGWKPTSTTGYETDDSSGAAAFRQQILSRPELAHVNAVKNGRVYLFDNTGLTYGGGNFPIGAAYMGKLLQPELFTDIDPQAIHQEYVDRFCHIDFNVYEHGVFVYPPMEEWKPWRS